MSPAGPATLVVRGIGELVTCDRRRGEGPGVVASAAVAASGGTIVHAGPEAELADVEVAAGAVELDARGGAVIPGFVDAHTHAIWLGDRSRDYALRAAGASYEDLAAAGGGIRTTVRATAAGGIDELVAAARPRLARMLAQGTTTVELKSGYGLDLDAELRQLEAARRLGADPSLPAVVTTLLALHALPERDRDDFLTAVCEDWLPLTPEHVRFADAFCETGAWTVAECERFLSAAGKQGLGARLHADQRSDGGGAALAARVGAVAADHLEHASDRGLGELAAAGVVGVLLPGAALVLGGPPPPGRRLLEAGARVAVATDCNPGTCWSESMPLMVSLAVATAGLTPAQALEAATAGGAAALGLVDRGVLAPGMRCDLVLLDTKHWLDVGYHLGGPVVRSVVRAGRLVSGALAGAPH